MSTGSKIVLAIALSLGAGCGTRTELRTRDAAPFVDDDPWLKIDAGAARPDGGADALDARDGRG